MSKTKAKTSPAREANPPPSVPRPAPATARQIVVQAVVLFSIALVVRALHFFFMRDALVFQALICDSGQYDRWAQEVASGQWMGTEVFYQTPLYPYTLAVIYTIVGHSIWAVRIVQAVFGGLACVFLARAGARYFSERVGWIAGLLLAFYPPAIFFDGILQKASLDLVLMAALLWVLAAVQEKPRWGLFAGAGAILAAASLNRENAAALFPVLLVWIGWYAWPRWSTQGWQWGLAFAAGAAALLLPVGLRNYHVGGTFALTTSQMGPNFYIGNHPGALGGYETLREDRGDPRFERLDAKLLAEADLQRPLSAGEVSSYWLNRSWTYIKNDPLGWARLLAWKWFLTWNALEMVDAEAIHTHEEHSPPLKALSWVLHFGVICPLGMLGLWWTRHDWRRLWLLYAMLAGFAAAVTVFYVFARYRYPLVPVAMLFAGAGLSRLWDHLRGFDPLPTRELTMGLVLGLATAVACNIPPGGSPQTDDALTYFNAGTTLFDEGRVDEAETLLKLSERLNPNFPAVYNLLGRLATVHNDLPEATRYYQRAIQLDPKHAVFFFNLGGVQAKEGNDAEADKSFRQAFTLDPLLIREYKVLASAEVSRDPEVAVKHLRRILAYENTATNHAELGRALGSAGRLTEAVAELRAAVKLDPKLVGVANNLAMVLAAASDDTLRNGAEAVALAEPLCRETKDQSPELLDTLAAAYAETGQFDKAVATADKAIALFRRQQQPKMAEQVESRRQGYLEKRPYRDPELKNRTSPKS